MMQGGGPRGATPSACADQRLLSRGRAPLSHLPDKHHENSAAHTVIAAPAAGRVSTSPFPRGETRARSPLLPPPFALLRPRRPRPPPPPGRPARPANRPLPPSGSPFSALGPRLPREPCGHPSYPRVPLGLVSPSGRPTALASPGTSAPCRPAGTPVTPPLPPPGRPSTLSVPRFLRLPNPRVLGRLAVSPQHSDTGEPGERAERRLVFFPEKTVPFFPSVFSRTCTPPAPPPPPPPAPRRLGRTVRVTGLDRGPRQLP